MIFLYYNSKMTVLLIVDIKYLTVFLNEMSKWVDYKGWPYGHNQCSSRRFDGTSD